MLFYAIGATGVSRESTGVAFVEVAGRCGAGDSQLRLHWFSDISGSPRDACFARCAPSLPMLGAEVQPCSHIAAAQRAPRHGVYLPLSDKACAGCNVVIELAVGYMLY